LERIEIYDYGTDEKTAEIGKIISKNEEGIFFFTQN